jgi:DnaK suppressor protein
MRTDIDFAQFRKSLGDQRRAIEERLNQETSALQTYSDSNPDFLDAATRSMTQGQRLSWINYLRGRQDQIIEAIQRIDAGQYGICIRCGKDIELERLKVKPYARYCMQCKETIERRRK